MPTVNDFRILQTIRIYLKNKLQLNGTKLIDHLRAKNVLTTKQVDDLEEVSNPSKRIENLVELLTKRPPCELKHFMDGLEGEQDHIKDCIQECLEKGNMPTVNDFRILQTIRIYLKNKLQLNGTKLIDHLRAKNVLTTKQVDDLEEVSNPSKRIENLVELLTKRPPCELKHFMDGLEGEQDHIKDYIQECLEKENNATVAGMMEDHEAMDTDEDEDTDVESDEQESTGSESDSEDEDSGSGHQLIKLKYLKTAESMQHLAVRVTVVERDKTEVKSGQEQFMAVVADDTSAVDVCVRNNEDLFHKFIVGGGVILVNVDWNGNVLFANEKCTATTVSPIGIKQHIIDEAFGQGEAVPISKARTPPVKSFVALSGKVVKQSDLTKERTYRKLLTHRQIKLEDRSGFVYVHVWGDVAVNLQAGDAIKITGCKIKKHDSVDDPEVTTTRKTCIQELHKSEFEDIHRERRLERGTLEGINVKIFASCTKPLCYHWKLDDGNYCESCACTIPDPVMYATADVVVITPRYKIRSLTVLWPQLRQLYRLFGKSISLRSSMSTLEDGFRHLQDNSVRYQTCGNVKKFRL